MLMIAAVAIRAFTTHHTYNLFGAAPVVVAPSVDHTASGRILLRKVRV